MAGGLFLHHEPAWVDVCIEPRHSTDDLSSDLINPLCSHAVYEANPPDILESPSRFVPDVGRVEVSMAPSAAYLANGMYNWEAAGLPFDEPEQT